MSALRVLIIGGNGIISAYVSRLAVELGHEVTLLNRGRSSSRPPIEGAETLIGDAGDAASIRDAVGTRSFDVVANFRSFRPAQVAADIEFFGGRTGQYLYISSASAYAKPVVHLPITEATPLRNPFWQYSRDKIASEDLLVQAHRETGFPVTIVRPSHTYDPSNVPLIGGWTALARIRDGKPVIVHGDGTSLWTLTHSRDFARAFVGLFANPHSIGLPVQITSDESLTWNAIAGLFGDAFGRPPKIVHVTSDVLAHERPDDIGPALLGDLSHSVIFDNARIKSLVPGWVATTPFSEGAREMVEWHLADPARQKADPELDALFDRLAG
jgi:nucleoside-diphosphate-sugar epimerase